MRFDSYHPMINLIYFSTAIGLTVSFNHPIFVGIAYVSAFVYSVKLNGKGAVIFNTCLIPLAIAYGCWYAYYNHFGVTNLRQNFIGNEITLEALLYGLTIAFTAAAVMMFLSCIFAVFSSDKIVYLFGRISPKLSLFISILLRTVPRVKKQSRKINVAQMGIGRSPSQGSALRRILNFFRLASVVITWTLENFVETAKSMKCRGYSLKGRTAYSIYRFDNRDRSFVVVLFLLLTVVLAAWGLNQTDIYFDPMIIMNPITVISYIFYAAYGVLLLLPAILQIIGEKRFAKLSSGGAGKEKR